jgi:hypothetical protein
MAIGLENEFPMSIENEDDALLALVNGKGWPARPLRPGLLHQGTSTGALTSPTPDGKGVDVDDERQPDAVAEGGRQRHYSHPFHFQLATRRRLTATPAQQMQRQAHQATAERHKRWALGVGENERQGSRSTRRSWWTIGKFSIEIWRNDRLKQRAN